MNLPASSRAVECVILFADLAGSTQLYERLGNREAFARVDRCLKAMQKVVANNGGRVVKLTGDGLLAVFADAGPVIDTTIAMTFEIGELPSSGESPIDIRIGFHFGPVLESEADVFGETVNIAARLCELASPGRALTTSETAARLSRGKQRMLRQLPPRPLKGINRPFELWELVCDDLGKVTAVFEGFDLTLATHELHLAFGDRNWILGHATPSLSIGRDPASDVVLRDELSSRRHCYIEERAGKFALIDCSSNGTFVTGSEGRTVSLHREELVLSDSGWITFGQPRGEGVAELSYRCTVELPPQAMYR
ncbi:adenylate/guanylate cyclase domain-containing protein [Cognatazoarcus halotolerans]|uniref:adenylate/guanylate cyclase domain-containing protein n=1 Tax=Cognatazoarcus halotolerans TaxID=2686016 RepID=UPI00135B1703|nr:adenylate/guanylate cyclase domain-containing protein [Cognatazoarcus halotolerans]MCB1901170.1 FHA domain-containing protein [Rhodocyclaceae bacterium]MCP5310379.1 FHA domain-containing protein [Zoogloeaceae bacterium]